MKKTEYNTIEQIVSDTLLLKRKDNDLKNFQQIMINSDSIKDLRNSLFDYCISLFSKPCKQFDRLCLHLRKDDFFILRFLRACKFNLEETRIRMQKYYKQRSDLPEWYMNKDAFLPELQELLDMGICLPLRKPDDQGRLVLLMRITSHDPRIHKISDLVKVILMVAEIAIKYYPAASVYGCTLFQDVIDSTLRHVAQYRPSILMNVVYAYQNYPLRIRSINIFNMPELFKMIIYIMKSFMSEEMRNRIHTYSHKTMQNCFKDIPANILPVEYGGTDGTIQELIEFWKKRVEENRDWILNEENYKVVISEQ